jgi:hypothetical protein
MMKKFNVNSLQPVDIQTVADRTDGYSGADIEGLFTDAVD